MRSEVLNQRSERFARLMVKVIQARRDHAAYWVAFIL